MKRGTLILFVLVVSVLLIVPASAAWIDWPYRKEHHINSSVDGELTTYQTSITVYRSAGSDSGNDVYLGTACEEDYADIRITADDGTTLLDMWVEEGYTSSSAEIWFEIPTLPAVGGYDIYVYYSNSSASTVSNGTATFSQFQDFNAGSLPSGWEAGGATGTSPTVSFSSGYMRVLASTTLKIQWVQQTTNASVDNTTYETRIRTDYSNESAVIEAVCVRDELGYPPIILAGYSYQSGAYRDKYTNYDAAGWGTGSAITGWSADTWHVTTLKRTGTDAKWYVDRANEVAVSSHYPTTASPFQYQVYGSAPSATYYGQIDVDWFLARDYTANEPVHSTWGSAETNPDWVITNLNFSANVTSGDAPLSVAFTGTSDGTPTAWFWDMDGDGDYDNITSQNPVFDYMGGLVSGYCIGYPDEVDIGQFNVSVYAYTDISNDTETKQEYITVNYAGGWLPDPLPVPSISANVTSGTAPLSVSFTGSATNVTPTAWYWDINGDSSTPYTDAGDFEYSTQNATHTYNTPGTYTVRLKAVCDDGYTVGSEANYITVTGLPPVAAFSGNNTTPCIGQSVLFTDASTNTPTSWAWSWDDGTANSTSQNPTHAWSAAGTYTVTLTATNADGSDVEEKVDYITVYDCEGGEVPPTPTPTPTTPPTPTPTWTPGTWTPTPTATVGGGLSFSGTVTLSTVNNSQYYDEMMAGNLTFAEVGSIIPKPIVDMLGGGDAGWGLFAMFMFGTIFVILFGRQRNVFIPAMLFLLSAFLILQYVVSEELIWMSYIILAASIGGVMFFVAVTRR